MLFSFAEIREPQELLTVVCGRSIKRSKVGNEEISKGGGRRRKLSEEAVIDPDESDESTTFLAADSAETTPRSNNINPRIQLDSYKKQGWISWNSRRLLSFKRARTEDNTLDKTTENCSTRDMAVHPFLDSDTDPVLQVQIKFICVCLSLAFHK